MIRKIISNLKEEKSFPTAASLSRRTENLSVFSVSQLKQMLEKARVEGHHKIEVPACQVCLRLYKLLKKKGYTTFIDDETDIPMLCISW